MPAVNIQPVPALPALDEAPVLCKKCGHKFSSYLSRTIGGETCLIDRDGNVIFDLVVTCRFCKDVFHWHSSTKEMQKMATAYQDMFDVLMKSLYAPGNSHKTE